MKFRDFKLFLPFFQTRCDSDRSVLFRCFCASLSRSAVDARTLWLQPRTLLSGIFLRSLANLCLHDVFSILGHRVPKRGSLLYQGVRKQDPVQTHCWRAPDRHSAYSVHSNNYFLKVLAPFGIGALDYSKPQNHWPFDWPSWMPSINDLSSIIVDAQRELHNNEWCSFLRSDFRSFPSESPVSGLCDHPRKFTTMNVPSLILSLVTSSHDLHTDSSIDFSSWNIRHNIVAGCAELRTLIYSNNHRALQCRVETWPRREQRVELWGKCAKAKKQKGAQSRTKEDPDSDDWRQKEKRQDTYFEG